MKMIEILNPVILVKQGIKFINELHEDDKVVIGGVICMFSIVAFFIISMVAYNGGW